MKRMFDTDGGLALDVTWQQGDHGVKYDSMFGTDDEASAWDTGGVLGYMQVTVPPRGERVLFKPYIQDGIGMLVNFGKKIENVGLQIDTTDGGVITADGCKAGVGLVKTGDNTDTRAIAIDSTGKTHVCNSSGGSALVSSSDVLLDLNDFFKQLIKYWLSIGFEVDSDYTLHIPASALQPTANGCYIKTEYLPAELWVRMNMPHVYQLPIKPLFQN